MFVPTSDVTFKQSISAELLWCHHSPSDFLFRENKAHCESVKSIKQQTVRYDFYSAMPLIAHRMHIDSGHLQRFQWNFREYWWWYHNWWYHSLSWKFMLGTAKVCNEKVMKKIECLETEKLWCDKTQKCYEMGLCLWN